LPPIALFMAIGDGQSVTAFHLTIKLPEDEASLIPSPLA